MPFVVIEPDTTLPPPPQYPNTGETVPSSGGGSSSSSGNSLAQERIKRDKQAALQKAAQLQRAQTAEAEKHWEKVQAYRREQNQARLPDYGEVVPGEWRAYGALMYDFLEEGAIEVDSEVVEAAKLALRNEPDLVSAVIGASSPEAAMGILFAAGSGELSLQATEQLLRQDGTTSGGGKPLLSIVFENEQDIDRQQPDTPIVYVTLQESVVGHANVQDTINAVALTGDVSAFFDRGEVIPIPQGSTIGVYERSPYNPNVVLVYYKPEEANVGSYVWIYTGRGVAGFDTTAIARTEEIRPDVDNPALLLEQIPTSNPVVPEERQDFSIHPEGTADLYPLVMNAESFPEVRQFGLYDQQVYKSTYGFHPGMDFIAPRGTPVQAVTDGIVIGYYAQVTDQGTSQYIDPFHPTPEFGEDPPGVQFIQGMSPIDEGNLGRGYVVVQSGDAIIVYAHLEGNSIELGTRVFAGHIMGAVGPYDSGSHLHLEVRSYGQTSPPVINEKGEIAQNPVIFINPAHIFTPEIRGDINEGLVAHNSASDTGNPGTDAFNQGTQAIGSGRIYVTIPENDSRYDQIDVNITRYDRWEDDLENLVWPE